LASRSPTTHPRLPATVAAAPPVATCGTARRGGRQANPPGALTPPAASTV